MEQGADDADKYDVFSAQKAVKRCHGEEAENAAAETVGERHHLPCQNAGDEDTHQQHEKRIFRGSIDQQPESDDICQPQFDAGNRRQGGQQRFYEKDCEGYGGVHGQERHASGFHWDLLI